MAFKIKNPINTPLKQMGPNPGPSNFPTSLISKLLTNDNIQNYFEFGKEKFDPQKDHQLKKDALQNTIDATTIAELRNMHPDASDAELKAYALNPNRGKIISGKKTRYNELAVKGQGYPSLNYGDMKIDGGDDDVPLGERGGADTPPIMPRNTLFKSNPNWSFSGYDSNFLVGRGNKPENSMFGMTNEEKTEHLKTLFPEYDARNPQWNDVLNETKTKDFEWFNNPITRDRWKKQAQYAGSDYTLEHLHGKDEYGNDQRFKNINILDQPNLMSDYDLDNMLTTMAKSNVTFKDRMPGDVLGSYELHRNRTDKPLNYFNTMSEILGLPSGKGGINNNWDAAGLNENQIKFQRFDDVNLKTPDKYGNLHGPAYPLGQVAGEEFMHASNIAAAMDPALRNTLTARVDSGRVTMPEYFQRPDELYAKFHKYRKALGMKPGEQFDAKKLKEYIKNSENPRDAIFNAFNNVFTEDSIIEALNTIASREGKSPGSVKFDMLSGKDILNDIEEDNSSMYA